MVQEKDIIMPKGCCWNDLIQYSGTELLEGYSMILLTLAKEKGMLGDIFAQSLSRFNNPINLKKLLNLINEIEWTSLDVDIKAGFYWIKQLGSFVYFACDFIHNSLVY
jgi:type I restriction enzyme M protein